MKTKRHYNNILTYMAAATLLLAVAPSCAKMERGSAEQEQRGEEEREPAEPLSLSYATLVEAVRADGSAAATKGTLVNNPGTESAPAKPLETEGVTDFHVAAWDLDGTSTVQSIPGPGGSFSKVHWFTTELVDGGVSRNTWNTVGSDDRITEYMWGSYKDRTARKVHGIRKAFYAYANLPEGSASPTVSVDGTTKLPGAMSLEYTVPSDAAAQTDLLVGYYTGEGNDAESGNPVGRAYLDFHHALTSVTVKLGDIKGVNTLTINTMSIEGVYSGGTLEMTPTGSGSAVTMAWTPASGSGSTTTVSQSVGMTVDVTSRTTSSSAADTVGVPFIVLPQDFKVASARLAVNVTADGETFDIYFPLDPSAWTVSQRAQYSDHWDMGVVYSYTVNYNGHEGVQLWANGPYWATKNIGAKNTYQSGWWYSWGNVKGYVPINLTPANAKGDYKCDWVYEQNPTVDTKLNKGFSSGAYSEHIQGTGSGLKADIPADASYDAAVLELGTKWRMPTSAEFEALVDSTDFTHMWRELNDGSYDIYFRFEGRGAYAGRVLILPYSGFGSGDDVSEGLYIKGTSTGYWSSTISSGGTPGAMSLKLMYELTPGGATTGVEMVVAPRHQGRLIRPVENTAYIE